MTTDDEFTSRLIGFGLSEKEAQTYLHLLKYRPQDAVTACKVTEDVS